MNAVKVLAIVTSIILVVALTLTALNVITWRLFWIIALAAAIIAYYVLPALRKKDAPAGQRPTIGNP